MTAPHSPELVQEPRQPPASPAAEVVRQVCRLLRHWSEDDDCTALILWLEGEQNVLAGPLLRGLLESLELYRRVNWIRHVANPKTCWARMSGGELGPPVYAVEPAPPGNPRLRLRRAAPFTPAEVRDFLAAVAVADAQDKRPEALRSVLSDVLWAAVSPLAQGPASPQPLQRLRERHNGRAAREQAEEVLAALGRPPPDGLHRCLRNLLLYRGPVEGCLTPQYEVRLFRHMAEVVPPLVSCEQFAHAYAAVEALREWVGPQECPATLRQVCEQANVLGRFARRLLPILAGPSAGAHRDWARFLLENLSRLGVMARAILGEPVQAPPAEAAVGQAFQPDSSSESQAGKPDLQGDVPGSSAPGVESPPPADTRSPTDTLPTAEAAALPAAEAERDGPAQPPPAEPAPPPEPAPAEIQPDAAALTELGPAHRVVGDFQEIVALADELERLVVGRWAEAADALQELRWPCKRFRQALPRAVRAAGEERTRLVKQAARELADELVNKIRGLDALLPGKGNPPPAFPAPPHFSGEVRDQLARKVKALRDRLFQVMQAHGNYEEHPAGVGESVRKYQDLDDVVFVAGSRARSHEILQVLLPGYVRRRADGAPELIRSPKVKVAR